MKQTKFLVPIALFSFFVIAHQANAAITVGSSSITGSGSISLQPASGNVGIGTSSPAATLDIVGAGSGDYYGSPALLRLAANNGNPWSLVFSRVDLGVNRDIALYNRGSNGLDFVVGDGLGSSYSALKVKVGSVETNNYFASYDYGWNGFAMASGGTYLGTITNPSADKWYLGYTTDPATVLASAALTWNSSGNVSIGTTTPLSKFQVTGGNVTFGPGTAHIISTQTTAPTASVTGTGYSGASMGSNSTDTKGAITATVGAAVGTLVVTFQTAYASAPHCIASPATATAQVDSGKMYVTSSTSALTLNFVATPTGGSETWNYICMQ